MSEHQHHQHQQPKSSRDELEKGAGDQVIGGSINGEAAVVIEVRKTGAETYLAQVPS